MPKVSARTLTCPTCLAGPGEPCTVTDDPVDHAVPWHHLARVTRSWTAEDAAQAPARRIR